MFFSYVKDFVVNSRRISAERLPFAGNASEFNRPIPKEYRGLKVRSSFGQANWANVTWIGFLAEGQKIQLGIYPVYLYYRDYDVLILAYGLSETNRPPQLWPVTNKESISGYFARNQIKIKKYRESLVFKAYDGKAIDSLSNDDDLNQLIDYYKEVMNMETEVKQEEEKKDDLQCIFFGCPGSGKSYTVKQIVEGVANKEDIFRTTFHPDSDYASFVGAYKPVKDEQRLTYEFIPQAFTDAYVAAWKDIKKPVFLVIEEINRGNCAQIFGDLFQLLDRDESGKSEYGIKADTDLKRYLEDPKVLGVGHEGIKNGELHLPNNLHIFATMNTSDQSLFPMDSAFKRRWSWKYIPIVTDNTVLSKDYTIDIDGSLYNWHEFLVAVNKKISQVTESEDKQMGNFFIKGSIKKEDFKSKVMFYLWSEVCKDEYKHNSFFKYNKDGEQKEFSFNDLFPDGGDILNQFIPQIIESEKNA